LKVSAAGQRIDDDTFAANAIDEGDAKVAAVTGSMRRGRGEKDRQGAEQA